MSIRLEHNQIDPEGKPYFIAEIGLNHNGDLELAKRMVKAAFASGAHAAKFQLFQSNYFIYSKARLGDQPEGSLQSFFKQFELTQKDWLELSTFTREQGLDFFCSVFDRPSLKFYKELKPKIIKISSCDLTNTLLLNNIQDILPKIPMIVSTGTCNESEIETFMKQHTSSKCVLLQCVSDYPANPSQYNLKTIPNWSKKYKVATGLSDHTKNNDVAIAATALGACVIEKHFTSDRNFEGPDQKLSLNPADFRDLVDRCNQIYQALGNGNKECQTNEEPSRKYGRRSLFSSCQIQQGDLILETNIIAQRPGDIGTPINKLHTLIGKKAKNDMAPYSPITKNDVQS